MNSHRQEPVAITGAGLICRRFDRELSPGALPPAAPFVYVDALPELPSAAHERVGNWLSSRSVALACGAALLAFGNNGANRKDCGAAISISKGLIERLEECVESLKNETGARSASGSVPMMTDCGADSGARLTARMLGLGGPASAAVAACASGLSCVKLGMDWIRDGVCETVLAGAAESSHSELILRSFERLGVISPAGHTRPFDIQRDGFVAGEGAGIFRLEHSGAAKFNAMRGKGPPILGKILSVALGSDAHHLTTPDRTGTELARVVKLALLRAGLDPQQIGWVHAHGTATAYNDDVEIAALRSVFGVRIPPVTATKGATGHLLGASGAVALGITLEALRGKYIPFIAGLIRPARAFDDIDFVIGSPRPSQAKTALVLNHGFGGHIAAAVIGV